jgi:hypothetical protein
LETKGEGAEKASQWMRLMYSGRPHNVEGKREREREREREGEGAIPW